MISTHALTWSATIDPCVTPILLAFQLTHSRGVRPHTVQQNTITADISTHALTWSATRNASPLGRRNLFQLTHSRGVRPNIAEPGDTPRDFNSRTHVECDIIPLSKRFRGNISTHALTWSATVGAHAGNRCGAFQLTHSRGVRRHKYQRIDQDTGISTHALTWSATRSARGLAEKNGYFNSRTHVECDFQRCLRCKIRFISTHALTWSATLNIVLKKDSPHSIWEVIAFYHQLS